MWLFFQKTIGGDVGRLAQRKKFSNWIASSKKNVNFSVDDNLVYVKKCSDIVNKK